MKSRRSQLLRYSQITMVVVSLAFSSLLPVDAAPQQMYVKFGYFNLALVKKSCSVDSDALRTQAEQQLRDEVEADNKKLQDAANRGMSKAELERMATQIRQEVNAHQQALIKIVNDSTASGNQKVASAVATIMSRRQLDVVVDGAGVYAGGSEMVNNGVDVTNDVIKELGGTAGSENRREARPMQVSFAFFNLAQVKVDCPEVASLDSTRAAEEQALRKEVEDGNAYLKQQNGKVSKAELERIAADIQARINANQKAAIERVNKLKSSTDLKVAQSVADLCRKYHTNVAVDGAAVFGGGQKVVSGVDLTSDVVAMVKSGGYSTYPVASSGSSTSPTAANSYSASSSSSSTAPIAMSTPATSSSYGGTPYGNTAVQTTPQPAETANTPAPAANPTSSAASEPASDTAAAINNTPIKDKWALIVGISNFAHPEYRLKYAAKDATDFKDFLINECHFAPDHVKSLTDQGATREAIMSAFGDTWLPRVVMPGDLVVIYVSTHGTPSRKDAGQKNYIVAYDTDRDKLFGTGVNMNDLCSQIKERVKTDRVLIVMDTCYSGAAAQGARGGETPDNFDVHALAQGTGRLVISSSSPNEQSWESPDYANGIFTHSLIKALRKQQTKVDVLTAFDEVKKNVQWEVQSNFGVQQTPVLGGKWDGIRLVISAPPAAPRTLPAALRTPQK